MARVDWVIVHHGPLPIRQVTAGHERESETGYSTDPGCFLLLFSSFFSFFFFSFFLRAKRQGVMKSKERLGTVLT